MTRREAASPWRAERAGSARPGATMKSSSQDQSLSESRELDRSYDPLTGTSLTGFDRLLRARSVRADGWTVRPLGLLWRRRVRRWRETWSIFTSTSLKENRDVGVKKRQDPRSLDQRLVYRNLRWEWVGGGVSLEGDPTCFHIWVWTQRSVGDVNLRTRWKAWWQEHHGLLCWNNVGQCCVCVCVSVRGGGGSLLKIFEL